MSANRDNDRYIGLIGESGHTLMALKRGDVVIATYLDHVEGKLWNVVPIYDRVLPAQNDERFGPNCADGRDGLTDG